MSEFIPQKNIVEIPVVEDRLRVLLEVMERADDLVADPMEDAAGADYQQPILALLQAQRDRIDAQIALRDALIEENIQQINTRIPRNNDRIARNNARMENSNEQIAALHADQQHNIPDTFSCPFLYSVLQISLLK